MNIADYLNFVEQSPACAVIVTTADAKRPVIFDVNEPLLALTGYSRLDLIGATPRILQGSRTSMLSLCNIARALRRRESVREIVVNYRANSTPYLCALEIHPLFDPDGELVRYVAFEREVVRRRGRPGSALWSRFVPRNPLAMLPSDRERLPAIGRVCPRSSDNACRHGRDPLLRSRIPEAVI